MKTIRRFRFPPMCLILLAFVVFQIPRAQAQLFIYNNRIAFLADVAAFGHQTLDFESQVAGTSLTDPTALEGITFSGFGSPDLIIDDTYEAASGDNYLGTRNAGTFNQFSYADSFVMSFASKNAIGLSIITAEVPGVTLFDDDIRIEVPGIGIASLDADVVDGVTSGGDRIYFIGIMDSGNSFLSARLEGSGALGFYNVDDITTAVIPEPGVGWRMMALSPFLLAACWRRRRLNQKSKRAEAR